MHPLRACSYYLTAVSIYVGFFQKSWRENVQWDLTWFDSLKHTTSRSILWAPMVRICYSILFYFFHQTFLRFSEFTTFMCGHETSWKKNTHAFACSLQHGLSCARIQLSTEIKSIGQGSCMFELLAMTQPWVNNSALISRWSGAKNLRRKSQAFKCNREQLFVCTRLIYNWYLRKCVLYVIKVQCE